MADIFPIPVEAYFAANTPEQTADCFTEDGIAVDERHTHKGRNAILRWREDVSKISFRQDIQAFSRDGARVLVSCRVSGDFKGSPVNLDYAFVLEGDRIARLEIT